jgi:hypothetical protein
VSIKTLSRWEWMERISDSPYATYPDVSSPLVRIAPSIAFIAANIASRTVRFPCFERILVPQPLYARQER